MSQRDNKGRFVKGHKSNTGKHQNPLLANELPKICTVCEEEFFLRYVDMSKYRRRKICTKKACASEARRRGMVGEKNHMWDGGKTPKDKRARFTARYKKWRTCVFERDNYTCQECKVVGGRLNADHIKPFSLFKNLRYDVSNGRTLCEKCHKKTDTYGVNLIYQTRRNELRGVQQAT